MMGMIRIVLIAVATMLAGVNIALAAEGAGLPQRDWSWRGSLQKTFFGKFDRAQLQRGLQVYTNVCASCHGLDFVAYRNLGALGYGEDEIKAFAAEYEVQDGPNDDGEMYMRPALPSDRFVSPYPNEQAARAANNGAYPPDLSLIVKARKDGANYLSAMLTGYSDDVPEVNPDNPEEKFELMEGMNYHMYFPGYQIAMPQPLYGDDVEYADGTPATIEQEAADVTAFLAWAAEPELEQRRSMGLKVLVFLIIFTIMLMAVKRRIWADVKH